MRHFSRHLAAHIDGQVAAPRARQIEIHIEQCARCRAEYEQIRFGMTSLDHLRRAEAPDAIWSSIEAALQEPRRISAFHRWRWAVAVIVVLALAGILFWRGKGEWIETDGRSRVTVRIGKIGSVEVEPNTRVRMVSEHRLALAHGEIRAKISAPPRMFFVDTASGTAVDLGCEYALNTGEDGLGLLRVTKGWVSFEWKKLESLVPAGASCRTRPQLGPGIPYFDDAPENLKQALESFGFEKPGDSSLTTILSASRVRDTLSLWHLLSRVEAGERALVYDRIAALTPIPSSVSRDLALKLDSATLTHLREELAWTW